MNHRLRLIFIAVAIFAWAGFIFSRLYSLQVTDSKEFRLRAERQYQSRIKLNPKRGVIYDSRGRILAINVDAPSVYAIPDEIANPEATAKELAPLLELKESQLIKTLEKKSSFVWVKRKISKDIKKKINALGLSGIKFVTESKRIFPGGRLASHVIGFVGIDNDGLAGLEYQYDRYLKGSPGLMLGIRGAKRGYNFSAGKVVKQPTGGMDIQLTLDSRLQYIVEEELKAQVIATGSESGTVVIMDPHSGAILAMANYPDFDPNDFAASGRFARKNRAVVDAYEPGSTFKLLVAAAALDAGLVSPEDKFDCEYGQITIGNRLIRDHEAFGILTFREIIEHSSNVGAIKVGYLIGNQRLWKIADLLGYGKGTGIDLPGENQGILRPTSRWSQNSYGSISIGQEVSGNSVQILQNIAFVANGGYWVKPYVVAEIRDLDGRVSYRAKQERKKVTTKKTVAILKELTRGVVVSGSGKLAEIPLVHSAGKTGTGEIAGAGEGYIPGAYLASFTGYMPAEDPQMVMVCLLDKPKGEHYGGKIAAPLFASIGTRIATEEDMFGKKPSTVLASDIQPDSNMTQQVSGEQDFQGKRTLSHPAAALIMPDLKGLSLKQAVARLARLGVIPRIEGSGPVVSQTPAAGQPIGGLTMIKCGGMGVAESQ